MNFDVHSSMYYSERSYYCSPLTIIQLSYNPTVVKDQQHPHDPWFLIELTSPDTLQSFDNGKISATFFKSNDAETGAVEPIIDSGAIYILTRSDLL